MNLPLGHSALLTLPHLQGHSLPPPSLAPTLVTSAKAFLSSCAHFSEFSWLLQFLSHLNSSRCNKYITYLAFAYIYFFFPFLFFSACNMNMKTHIKFGCKKVLQIVSKGSIPRKFILITEQKIQNYTLCLLDKKFHTFHTHSFICMCAIS